MFSLKEPSLLAFDERRDDSSLKNLYKIKSIPSDTQHRVILDSVDPQEQQEWSDRILSSRRGGGLGPSQHEGRDPAGLRADYPAGRKQ